MAGIFGMVHDQVTYTIGPSYFHAFKFEQFKDFDFGLHPRFFASIIGFLATWWVGMIIGWLVGRVCYSRQDHKIAFKKSIKAIACIFALTILFGIVAYFISVATHSDAKAKWWCEMFSGISIDQAKNFRTVGYIHNAGYLGAIFGGVGALVYVAIKPKPPTDI